MSRIPSSMLNDCHRERAAAVVRADRAELRVRELEGKLALAQAAAEARAPNARVAELEKGILVAVRVAAKLSHEPCAGGDNCDFCSLVRFLIDLRRGTERPAAAASMEDVDSAIESLEALVAHERQRAAAAELRATALERELALAHEAARELGFAYMRDERPPARAVSYATSLPAPAPVLPPADETPGGG